jgi:hypothetical protein
MNIVMGWTCNLEEIIIQKFCGKTSWKQPLGRLRRREDKIKMDLAPML